MMGNDTWFQYFNLLSVATLNKKDRRRQSHFINNIQRDPGSESLSKWSETALTRLGVQRHAKAPLDFRPVDFGAATAPF